MCTSKNSFCATMVGIMACILVLMSAFNKLLACHTTQVNVYSLATAAASGFRTGIEALG